MVAKSEGLEAPWWTHLVITLVSMDLDEKLNVFLLQAPVETFVAYEDPRSYVDSLNYGK